MWVCWLSPSAEARVATPNPKRLAAVPLDSLEGRASPGTAECSSCRLPRAAHAARGALLPPPVARALAHLCGHEGWWQALEQLLVGVSKLAWGEPGGGG